MKIYNGSPILLPLVSLMALNSSSSSQNCSTWASTPAKMKVINKVLNTFIRCNHIIQNEVNIPCFSAARICSTWSCSCWNAFSSSVSRCSSCKATALSLISCTNCGLTLRISKADRNLDAHASVLFAKRHSRILRC